MFTCGRFKGKTFQEVLDSDPAFCELALRCDVNKYCPEEFKQFLKSKRVIKEYSPVPFLKALSPEQTREFKSIVGELNVEKVQVHEPSEVDSNGFLAGFCQFFVEKCIFNAQGRVAVLPKSIEIHATIFPFRVTPNVAHFDVPVKKLFSLQFEKEVGDFFRFHFNQVDYTSSADLFLRNIFAFRRDHFTESELKKLEAVAGDLSRPIRNTYRRPVNEYLKNFPSLNNKGVTIFRSYCDFFDKIRMESNIGEISLRRDRAYFLRLPEVNLYELFRLLDENFYKSDYKSYAKSFLKYIFFFEHAVRCDSNPVFFIDDLLFECLKWLSTYKSLDQDFETQKTAVSMVTIPWCRKYGAPRSFSSGFDDLHLQRMRNYVTNIPNVELAVVAEDLFTDILQSRTRFRIKDILYDVRFSKQKKKKIGDFDKLILLGVLFPATTKIKKLVLYNAKTGFECRADMPEAVDEIRNFVRRINRTDFSVELPPEAYLMSMFAECLKNKNIP